MRQGLVHALRATHARYDVMDDIFMMSPLTMVWPICLGRPSLTHSSWPGPNRLQKKIK